MAGGQPEVPTFSERAKHPTPFARSAESAAGVFRKRRGWAAVSSLPEWAETLD